MMQSRGSIPMGPTCSLLVGVGDGNMQKPDCSTEKEDETLYSAKCENCLRKVSMSTSLSTGVNISAF